MTSLVWRGLGDSLAIPAGMLAGAAFQRLQAGDDHA
jgi:hypothetical protein